MKPILASAIALLLLGATALPCAAGRVPGSTPMAGQSAHHAHHPSRGHATHRADGPDLHTMSHPALWAPCPCGCSDRAGPSGSVSRLGAFLPVTAPDRAIAELLLSRVTAPLRIEEAPSHGVDHVPRV